MRNIGFVVIITIYSLLNFYIYIHGRYALPSGHLIQTIYTSVFLVFSLSFLLAVTLEGKIPWVLNAVLENIGGFWMIVFLYFLATVLIADLFSLTSYFTGFLPHIGFIRYAQIKLIYFGLVLLVLLVFSVIGYIRFTNPKIVKLNIDVPQKDHQAEKLSIVAVSDVHLGDVIRKKRLEKYVRLINNQHPDIILIVGDLFDRNLNSVRVQGMESVLQKLRSTYGTYAVVGNHEYFGNVKQAVELMSRSGITVLRDSVVAIDNKLILIGRDDFTNKERKNLKSLLSTEKNTGLPTLVMDHQPVNLSEAVENNIDIQISGHTHNGQIYPFSLLVSRFFELAYGYRKIRNTHFYVSSGLGLWGAPIRLGTQSEIVKIQLNPAGQ